MSGGVDIDGFSWTTRHQALGRSFFITARKQGSGLRWVISTKASCT